MELNAQTNAVLAKPRLYLDLAQQMGVVDYDQAWLSASENPWETLIERGAVSEQQLIQLANNCKELQKFAVELRLKHFPSADSTDLSLSHSRTQLPEEKSSQKAQPDFETPEYYRQGIWARVCERVVNGFGVYEAVVLFGTLSIIALVGAIVYVLMNQFPSELMQTQFDAWKTSSRTAPSKTALVSEEFDENGSQLFVSSSVTADSNKIESPDDLDVLADDIRAGRFDLAKTKLGEMLSGENFEEYESVLSSALCGLHLEVANQSDWSELADELFADANLQDPDWRWMFAIWLLNADQALQQKAAQTIKQVASQQNVNATRLLAWIDARGGQAENALRRFSSHPAQHVLDRFFFCLATHHQGQSPKIPQMIDYIEHELADCLPSVEAENDAPRKAIETRRRRFCHSQLAVALEALRGLDMAEKQ